jgi:ATP synthase H subunit
MILESLQKIKKAEAEVQERIEHAKGEAIRIVEEAKEEADKILSEKKKDSQTQAEEMKENAKAEAINEGRAIADEWKKGTEAFDQAAQKNLEHAKEFILGSLLR